MRHREHTPEELERLRELRRRLGDFLARKRAVEDLSREAASLNAGLDSKTVGRIERGEVTPPFETLMLLAAAFGRTPAQFLRGLAHSLEGAAFKENRECVGRYRIKEGPCLIEIWRVKRGK